MAPATVTTPVFSVDGEATTVVVLEAVSNRVGRRIGVAGETSNADDGPVACILND